MAIYTRDTLPEADGLVELTRQELYESTDLYDTQKRHLFRAIDFIEAMGLSLYFCPEYPCLYISDGEIYSEILTIDERGLENMMYTLEFMCALGHQGKKSLEQRVEALERAVFPDNEVKPKEPDDKAEPEESGDVPESAASVEKKLAELRERARRIGNDIYTYSTMPLHYVRPRRKVNGKNSPTIFTVGDALNPKRKRDYNGGKWWCFWEDELDELERFIAHDEEIYYSHFPDGRP